LPDLAVFSGSRVTNTFASLLGSYEGRRWKHAAREAANSVPRTDRHQPPIRVVNSRIAPPPGPATPAALRMSQPIRVRSDIEWSFRAESRPVHGNRRPLERPSPSPLIPALRAASVPAVASDASEYFGEIDGCRYGWDVQDPADPNDPNWAVDWGDWANAPTQSFGQGTQHFVIQTRDSSGTITRVVFELTVLSSASGPGHAGLLGEALH